MKKSVLSQSFLGDVSFLCASTLPFDVKKRKTCIKQKIVSSKSKIKHNTN